jgi:hypothetical protein
MDPTNKKALRVAVLIHEQLAGGQCHDSPVYLPEYAWNNVQNLRRQIDLARQRGWHRAAAQLTKELGVALDDFRRQLENAFLAMRRRLDTCRSTRSLVFVARKPSSFRTGRTCK